MKRSVGGGMAAGQALGDPSIPCVHSKRLPAVCKTATCSSFRTAEGKGRETRNIVIR
jgi:hypothetical protein